MAMKGLNPDYIGFRGYAPESTASNQQALETVTCSRCGRNRNVPTDVATEHSDDYVCATCQEELDGEVQEETPAVDEGENLESPEEQEEQV